MKNFTITLLTVLLMTTACTKKTEEVNPFMADYNTPFNVPPFDRISEKHYLPAFEEGMKKHNLEIQDIVNNVEEPTFKNTIEALEYSGRLLADVQFVFYNAYSSNTNDEIQNIATEIAPKLSLHADNIKLNAGLFERVNAVYAQKEDLDLNAEQRKLLEETYKGFVRSGAGLPEENQNRLREINQELSVLTLKFGQNVLGETNKFKMIVDNEADLAGLPQSLIDVAAEKAAEEGLQGKWIFTLHNSSVMPFLGSADKRELRKVMQQAYINRGNNNNEYDNKETIGKIVNLRLERAKLLGYDNHAHYTLEETMVKNTETAMNFVRKVWDAATPIAKKEAGEMQTMIKSEGNDFKLAQWDWRYYAEKIRKEKYDLDEEQVRQYFELNTVRSGVFMVVNKLYGLQFKERTDIPKYHPDAQVFEVLEADNSHVGILYMDFHPRESKNSGAWMSSYRDQYIDRNGN